MAVCTMDGDAKDTAQAASDLYARGQSGEQQAALNFVDVMQAVNYNVDCGGHDQFVDDVFKQLSGPLAADAVLGKGERPGYPRLEQTSTVSEIHVPSLVLFEHPKGR